MHVSRGGRALQSGPGEVDQERRRLCVAYVGSGAPNLVCAGARLSRAEDICVAPERAQGRGLHDRNGHRRHAHGVCGAGRHARGSSDCATGRDRCAPRPVASRDPGAQTDPRSRRGTWLWPSPVRRGRSRGRDRSQVLARGDRHESANPRLWHTCRGGRRRQGLHGPRRPLQRRQCDVLLASGRREQRFTRPQPGNHRREIPLSRPGRACGSCARPGSFRARWRRGHELHVNYMREHVPQDVRIHYVITNGGAAPNIVPEFAESYYYVRHPDPRVVADVFERVKKAAEGAALGTGTTFDYEVINGDYSILPNDVLGRLMDSNLRRVGGPVWTSEEMAFAEKLQKTLPGRTLPALTSASEIHSYRFNGQKYASTDSGDVSWVTPLATLNTATWVPGTAAHSWQATAAGGMSIGLKGAVVAAKTLALTVAQVSMSPELIAAAKAEFDKSRGPGFVYKSLIGDRAPPLDYRKASSTGARDPG